MMTQFHEFLSKCIVCYDNATGRYMVDMPAAEQEADELSVVEPVSHMEQQKAIYHNAYSPWSEEDDQRLAQLYMSGKNIDELMIFFQRNRGSIISRLRKLGYAL